MIRRRHRPREIEFSFDSFLDVVANVVGIIIRLILVVWVSARSYHSIQPQSDSEPRPAAPAVVLDTPLPADPLEAELERNRLELARARARLLEQLRQFQHEQEVARKGEERLTSLNVGRDQLLEARAETEQRLAAGDRERQAAALSVEDLRRRGRQLADELKALEKLPPVKQSLRYRTPVSRPVNSEEVLFECRRGRVTFIDIAALLQEVKLTFDEKGERLKSQWRVEDVAGPVGAFRLRYAVERERGTLDSLSSAASPEARASFRFGLSEWKLDPVSPVRGETGDEALAESSEFRHVADGLDPHQSVITFWVYPDSFALYRRLRDYLYDRDIVVAGRPLPEGVPIASSRRGTVSRGQ